MKRLLAIILTLLLTLSLAACGSKTYQVTTKSGQNYTSKGSPDYDVKAKTYTFTNEKGEQVILNQEDIEVIREEKKK